MNPVRQATMKQVLLQKAMDPLGFWEVFGEAG